MLAPAENPMAALLATRQSRSQDGLGRAPWIAALVLACGGVALSRGDDLAGAVALVAVALLALLPLLQAQSDSLLLRSFRRGGCMDDLLGTRTSAAEMVDGIALHGARSLLVAGVPWWVLLLAWNGFSGSWPWLAALAWLPALAGLGVLLSYLGQVLAAWGEGEGLGRFQALGAGLVLLPGFLLAAPFLTDTEWRPGTAWFVLAGAGLAWSLVSARWLALLGLERLEDWRHRMPGRFRNRWVRPWTANPLVSRQSAREAAAVPLGLVGLLGWRFGGAALLAAVLVSRPLAEATERPAELATSLWTALALLGVLMLLRAGASSTAALAEETEAHTREILHATGLSADEYVDGVAAAGWIPRLQEAILVAPILLFAGYHSPVPMPLVGWGVVLLGLLPMLGSYAAVWAASRCRSRARLAEELMNAALAISVPPLLLTFLLPAAWPIWLLVAPAATMVWFRADALRLATHGPERAGFSPARMVAVLAVLWLAGCSSPEPMRSLVIEGGQLAHPDWTPAMTRDPGVHHVRRWDLPSGEEYTLEWGPGPGWTEARKAALAPAAARLERRQARLSDASVAGHDGVLVTAGNARALVWPCPDTGRLFAMTVRGCDEGRATALLRAGAEGAKCHRSPRSVTHAPPAPGGDRTRLPRAGGASGPSGRPTSPCPSMASGPPWS